jgi:4-amino-4-deoxy-L-arabinose transferase-like glycosyltransferase
MEKSVVKNSINHWTSIPALAKRWVLSKTGALVLLIVITAPLLLPNLASDPAPWFDEGYKANLVRTLAERGIYATYSVDGYNYFDPAVTNGPVDTFLMALVMKLCGTGFIQGRLVTVLFTWSTLVSLYAIAVFIYGRKAALFSVLFLVAVPPLRM